MLSITWTVYSARVKHAPALYGPWLLIIDVNKTTSLKTKTIVIAADNVLRYNHRQSGNYCIFLQHTILCVSLFFVITFALCAC